MVARGCNKTKKCSSCNRVNDLGKVRIIKGFHQLEQAMNALRYLKIPKEKRGEIPYLRGEAVERKKTPEQILSSIIAHVRKRFPAGIKLEELKKHAQKAGIDSETFDEIINLVYMKGEALYPKRGVIKFF